MSGATKLVWVGAALVCVVVGLYTGAHRRELPDLLVLQTGARPGATRVAPKVALVVFATLVFGLCLSQTILGRSLNAASAGLLATANLAWIGVIGTAAVTLLQMNLGGQPRPAMVGAAVTIAVAATVLLALAGPGSRMGGTGGHAMGEMVHRSIPLAIAFFVVLGGVGALSVSVCPDWICRTITIIAGLAVLWAGSLAAVGFRYRLAAGHLEVVGVRRTIVSVPLAAVSGASIGRLDRFVGYGIRGIAGGRAFVLSGRTGVWITTPQEKLFLAHREPERLLEFVQRALRERPDIGAH